jgi:hypothetical protein
MKSKCTKLVPMERETLQVYALWPHSNTVSRQGRYERKWPNDRLPNRWVAHAGPDDDEVLHWPPCSPDVTPSDFVLWGFVKDRVFMPFLPQTLLDLRARITAPIAAINHGTH